MIQNQAGAPSSEDHPANSGPLLALALVVAIESAMIAALICGIVTELAENSTARACIAAGSGFVALAGIGITIVRIIFRR
jgi:hypothetical protein